MNVSTRVRVGNIEQYPLPPACPHKKEAWGHGRQQGLCTSVQLDLAQGKMASTPGTATAYTGREQQ